MHPFSGAASGDEALVLSRALTGQRGPGHNSLLTLADGSTVIAYHAWEAAGQRRQMHLRQVIWQEDRPVVGGATDHDLRGV